MLPGFTVPFSLGKAQRQYASASEAGSGLALLVSTRDFPTLSVSPTTYLTHLPFRAPFPAFRSCGSCYLDETGSCVRDCTTCAPGQPPDGCQDFTRPCPAGACCPTGQDPCPGTDPQHPGLQFCCPPNTTGCCNAAAHLCCPADAPQCCSSDHCCGESENCCTLPGAPGCCPADQACTFQGCCPQQNVPCGDQCCALALPAGAKPACCNGTCSDTNTDPFNCGGCGQACSPPAHAAPICVPGTPPKCDFVCNDAGWPKKCGGQCCPANQVCCNNVCLDPQDYQTDVQNCGGCGTVCTPPANATPVCSGGKCDFACNDRFTPCGNACVNEKTDKLNCGGCGVVCPTPANATAFCNGGQCDFACSPGFAHCVGGCCPAGQDCCNGTCTQLGTSLNCASCGNTCADPTPFCVETASGHVCSPCPTSGQVYCPAGNPADTGHCCSQNTQCCYFDDGTLGDCCAHGMVCDHGVCRTSN